jgi:di/tricarboxylate transporter
MILIMNALSQDGEVTPSRMLLPLAVMSSLWVGHLPIGIGATTYIMPNKFIASYKSAQLLQIWDIAKVNIIPMILGGVYILFTYKWLPKRSILSNKLAKVKENEAISKKHETIILVIFVLVMASMFLSNQLGDLMYITPIVGTLILVFTGAMNEKETKVVLSSDIIFMLAGIFVLADVIAASGAGNLIGKGILTVLGGNPSGLAVLFAFGIVSIILTQFMSNSGCKNVLIPMAVATCIAAKYDPRGVICVVELCCSASAILPTASPACAIAFAAGEYKLSETFKWSLPLVVITLVSVVLSANFFFPI